MHHAYSNWYESRAINKKRRGLDWAVLTFAALQFNDIPGSSCSRCYKQKLIGWILFAMSIVRMPTQ